MHRLPRIGAPGALARGQPKDKPEFSFGTTTRGRGRPRLLSEALRFGCSERSPGRPRPGERCRLVIRTDLWIARGRGRCTDTPHKCGTPTRTDASVANGLAPALESRLSLSRRSPRAARPDRAEGVEGVEGAKTEGGPGPHLQIALADHICLSPLSP